MKWWKVLGILLILYSLIAGMLVPLGAGIIRVEPRRAAAGTPLVLEVTGYNSTYRNGDTKAWLKYDDQHALSPRRVTVQNDRDLRLDFVIPKQHPGRDSVNALNLILFNPRDGYSVLPSAVFTVGATFGGDISPWLNSVEVTDASTRFHFPYRNILGETIRNTYYHVPLWMAMMVIFAISMWYSVGFLRRRDPADDQRAEAFASTGLLFGILGIVTGMVWAKNTWGAYWSFDVKQNMAAIALLIYAAYFMLRSALPDRDTAARFSSVYNIFAFILLIPLLYIIPRMTASLHPGSGGNPAFASDDLDSTMRMVFYPAVAGWILMGCWISQLRARTKRLYE
ncbi:MAG: cytochrome c biogenesis protein [Saprospiraceae bacterium]|nr:cytochrome c biogenesis protein [Saprospiraceae bacterium]